MENQEKDTKKDGKEKVEEKVKERKEKIKNWLKDPYNLVIIGILIFAFVIRLYYLLLMKNQPLWYDEAEYATMAKVFVSDLEFNLNPQRIFLFPWLASAFFLFNFSEAFIKFLFVVIPSSLLVFFVYLLGKEMFDKKVALIASILTAVSWTLLFWSARFQPDFLSMCCQVLTCFFIWKYWKKPSRHLIIYSAIFASLGFMFKVSGLLVPTIIFVFIILKERISFLKNKDYWIFLLVFVLTFSPQFIYSYFVFGDPIALFGSHSGYVSAVARKVPFAFNPVLGFYSFMVEKISFYLFLFGIVISLRFLLYLDMLIKDKRNFFSPEIFSLLSLLLISAFYIFYIKAIDDRWVFLWLPFMFFFISRALLFIHSFFKKYNKIIALSIILLLILMSCYYELKHADTIIKVKKDTYVQIKDAALWIKENSNPEDIVVSASQPQNTFYSERKTITQHNSSANRYFTPEEFDNVLMSLKPKYYVVSIFEPAVPQWTYSYPQEREFKPVKAWFAEPENKQPILIIYEISYDKFDNIHTKSESNDINSNNFDNIHTKSESNDINSNNFDKSNSSIP